MIQNKFELPWQAQKIEAEAGFLNSQHIEIEKEKMASRKLTREIVFEKKAANSEGMGRFAHKLISWKKQQKQNKSTNSPQSSYQPKTVTKIAKKKQKEKWENGNGSS